MIDKISKLPTNTHFLDLSETCLYMVHFGLGPFSTIAKNCLHTFTIKVNQNPTVQSVGKFYVFLQDQFLFCKQCLI